MSLTIHVNSIHKYASCSNECFILALIYIDRLIQRSNFLLTELNVHRVVITAVLLAAKFFDDAYYNNAYYAKVGGVLVSEMNGLEVDFLFRINFSLHVTPDVFEKYRMELMVHSTSVPLSMSPMVEAQPAPVMHSVHTMYCEDSAVATQQRVCAPQITPSPPHDAGSMDPGYLVRQAEMIAASSDPFLPMQRANSMPLKVTVPGYYVPHHTTTPPRCHPGTLPGFEDPYAMMEGQLFPLPAMHHFQRAASDQSAYGQMLAGLSGAGM